MLSIKNCFKYNIGVDYNLFYDNKMICILDYNKLNLFNLNILFILFFIWGINIVKLHFTKKELRGLYFLKFLKFFFLRKSLYLIKFKDLGKFCYFLFLLENWLYDKNIYFYLYFFGNFFFFNNIYYNFLLNYTNFLNINNKNKLFLFIFIYFYLYNFKLNLSYILFNLNIKFKKCI